MTTDRASASMTDLRPQHTLVIPTFNRPDLLNQLLRYYQSQPIKLNLLVLDSSFENIAKTNAANIAVQSADIRHEVYPDDMPMAVKLLQGFKFISTPFVSFCADDDIVFPASLVEACQHLVSDPSAAATHGYYVNFRRVEREVYIQREYSGPSIDAAHSGARLFKLHQNYESLFYAVCRTPDLQRVFADVAQIDSLSFQELFQSIGLLILGKATRFQKFYAGRQSCEPAEPDRKKWQTYYWFADERSDYIEHYLRYRSQVLSFYQRNSKDIPLLRDEEILKTLDLSHTVYFSSSCPPGYFHEQLQHLWPTDEFTDPSTIDPILHLNPYTRPGVKAPLHVRARRWLARRLVVPIRYNRNPKDIPLQWSKRSSKLDRLASELGGSEWKCRIPTSIDWLGDVPDFQNRYLDLCKYLNFGS